MRIVHLQHPYIENRGYQENYLPERQKQLGHDVHIVTTDVVPHKFREEEQEDYQPGEYTYDGVPTYRCRSISYDTEAATLPIGAVRKIIELEPDVIHSHRLISFLSFCSITAKPFSEAKLFFDIHVDNDNFHLDEPYKKAGFAGFRELLLPIIKRSADGFIAVNPYARQFLRDRLQIADPHLLPLGADAHKFSPSVADRAAVRRELDIAADRFVAIVSGNLNESKNVTEIIESIDRIESENFHLVILGGGDERYLESLRDSARSLGVSSQITFHDFVDHDELPRFYNAADLGIWPGKLGITVIEAISCGLPVIVPESEATNFLVANENGTSLAETTPDSIANAVQQYIENPDLRDAHARNSRQLAESELSWEAIAEKSIEIYHGGDPDDETISTK